MTSRSITRRRLARALTVLLLAAIGGMTSGCAVHAQGPIKEVAYDFSDADFYDRDYAPSPAYGGQYQEIEEVLPVVGDALERDQPNRLSIRQPSP